VMQPWSAFKASCSTKSMPMQLDEDGTSYFVFAIDGLLVYSCRLWKGTVPDGPGFDQVQNDADVSDLSASYIATGKTNNAIQPKAKDGRLQYKLTLANRCVNFKKRSMYFKTANSGSLHNKDPNGNDYGDCSYKMYDSGGAETTTDILSVKTVLDWEPATNYEIIAGGIDIDPVVSGGTTDLWWIAAVGVPDYPAVYGGSIDYINETNMEMLAGGRYVADGRSISFLANQATSGAPHTNKMRFIVKHPLGAVKRFQIYIEAYY
jgi:hypothetical protein